jgi:hypothetical protein
MHTWGIFSWTIILLGNFPLYPRGTCLQSWYPSYILHCRNQRTRIIWFLHRLIWWMVFLHKLGIGVDFLKSRFFFSPFANRFHLLLPCFLHVLPVLGISSRMLIYSFGVGLVTKMDVINYSEWMEIRFFRFLGYLKGVRWEILKLHFLISRTRSSYKTTKSFIHPTSPPFLLFLPSLPPLITKDEFVQELLLLLYRSQSSPNIR